VKVAANIPRLLSLNRWLKRVRQRESACTNLTGPIQ
jgi:hypothetical protein